jgi:hypothetical protein
MLNLRGDKSLDRAHSTIRASTIRFNTNMLVGNMGQSLRFGSEEDDIEMEDDGHINQEVADNTDCSRVTTPESINVSALFYCLFVER